MSLPIKPNANAYLDLFEMRESLLARMIREWEDDPSGIQKWTVVEAKRTQRIWSKFVETGIVADVRGLERIAARVVENTLRLSLNTAIAGHTQSDPDEMLEGAGLTDPADRESFTNWAISLLPRDADGDHVGGMRISDYGCNKLMDIAALILDAKTPEQKATYLNMAMDVAHQRSDLASWFIEGGAATLSEISNPQILAEVSAPSFSP